LALKPINNGLFPSAEILQIHTVRRDGFELFEIWLGKKRQNTVKCKMCCTSLSY